MASVVLFRSGMVVPKLAKIGLLILLVATIVCVAGVLILPQVDLPDFVLNGSKVSVITAFHVRPVSSSSGSHFLEIRNPVLELSRFQQFVAPASWANVFPTPTTLLSLRC